MLISAIRGGTCLPHLCRVRNEDVARVARFRVIIWETVRLVKRHPGQCQPGSRQNWPARLLYDRRNFLKSTSVLRTRQSGPAL